MLPAAHLATPEALLIPGLCTVLHVHAVIVSLLHQSKRRYAVVDANKKSLLPHPYKPWDVEKTALQIPEGKDPIQE